MKIRISSVFVWLYKFACNFQSSSNVADLHSISYELLDEV